MTEFFDGGLDYETMEEFDREFEQATIRRGTINLPDGYYQGFIGRFYLYVAINGKTYLKIVIVLLSPGVEGHLVIKWIIIDPKDPKHTAKRLKPDLTTLGYEWRGIQSLTDERKWSQMVGKLVDFKTTHRKKRDGSTEPFMNIWISRTTGKVSDELMRMYAPWCAEEE